MAEIADILSTLLDRTNQDRVRWQTTAADETFLVVLGNSSISIGEEYYDASEKQYTLKVLNQEGREIERMDSVTSSLYDRELSDLYLKARRVALGVDSQLDSLLQELEAEV